MGASARWLVLGHPCLRGDLDGVPGRAQRRCVGEVEVIDVGHVHAVEERGGVGVDPLGGLGGQVPDELGT